MPLTAFLVVCRAGAPPERRTVTGGRMTLGRAASCDWQLPNDKEISKQHCVIELEQQHWVVRDVSTNGTYLNDDTRAIGPNRVHRLRHGDRLWISSYQIDFHISGPPSSGFRLDPDIPGPPDVPVGSDWNDDSPHGEQDSPWDSRNSEDGWDHDPVFHDTVELPRSGDTAAPLSEAEGALDDAPPGMTGGTLRLDERSAVGGLASLLAGANLEVEMAARAAQKPEATLKAAGQALRAAISGLRALLRARDGVKQSYRIESTIVGDNALKFSATDEIALALLLDPKRNSLRDVEDVIKDLQNHQMATSVATQKAAKELLAQLAPSVLEGEDANGVQLPGLREKRLWEAYKKHHARVVEQFEDNFKSEFYTAFAIAYEQATGKRKKAKQ